MLVLSRKPSEKVKLIVGNIEIIVTVNSLDRNQVKLGFDAPSSVRIVRTEIEGRAHKRECSDSSITGVKPVPTNGFIEENSVVF